MCLIIQKSYKNPEISATGPIYRYKLMYVYTSNKDILISPCQSTKYKMNKWRQGRTYKLQPKYAGIHVFKSLRVAKRYNKIHPRLWIKVIVKFEVKGFLRGGAFKMGGLNFASETWKWARPVEIIDK